MSRYVSILVVVSMSSAGQIASGQWVQWTVTEGGNGHWYRLVDQEETWDDANANARSRGGYLVTILDANENAWLITQFASATSANNALWTGFYQDTTDSDFSETDHGWKWFSDPAFCRWSTGNPDVCYANWRAGEPNDSPVGDPVQHQNCTQWYTSQNGPSFPGTWDDQYCDSALLKSIIEAIDCNENGIRDECDLDCGVAEGDCDVAGCGQSSDSDGDGVPDECDGCPGFDDAVLPCPIPAVSTWGLTVMVLLLLAAGTLAMARRKPAAG